MRATMKEHLFDSLHELCKRKPYDKISVLEIAEKCETSARTFYYHFKDKDDLVMWRYKTYAQTSFNKTMSKGLGYSSFIRALYEGFAANNFYCRNLIDNTNGFYAILKRLLLVNMELFIPYIRDEFGAEVLSDHVVFSLECYLMLSLEALSKRGVDSSDLSAETAIEWLVSDMPPGLKPFLLPQETSK